MNDKNSYDKDHHLRKMNKTDFSYCSIQVLDLSLGEASSACSKPRPS